MLADVWQFYRTAVGENIYNTMWKLNYCFFVLPHRTVTKSLDFLLPLFDECYAAKVRLLGLTYLFPAGNVGHEAAQRLLNNVPTVHISPFKAPHPIFFSDSGLRISLSPEVGPLQQ